MSADALYEGFVRACGQLCDDLDATLADKIDRLETEYNGITFEAEGKGKLYNFQFYLDIRTREKDFTKGRLRAEIHFGFAKKPGGFVFDDPIDHLRGHDNFISRWAAEGVAKFMSKANPLDLESLCHDEQIRVCGVPEDPFPTIPEMRTLITGLKPFQTDVLYVYRLRHIRKVDKYRSFSYAFRVAPTGSYFWVFFLGIGGLDSGGNYGYFQEIEHIIESARPKLKIQRQQLDIEYEQLVKFLHKSARGLRFYNKTEYDYFEPSEEAFDESFVAAYRRFRSRYDSEQYAEALRDLRALVQDALIATYDKKKVDIGNTKRDIHTLSDRLINDGHLDESLRYWFFAFSAIANRASHGDYPKIDDLFVAWQKERIMATFMIGMQLIMEIDAEIGPDVHL